MQDLIGKVALVTGGSRGIGRAIAIGLGAAGAAVVVNFRTDEGAAREVVETIERAGGRAMAAQADMSVVSEVRQLFAEALAWGKGLDIVVNNAGTAKFENILEVTEAEYERQFGLNARGVFFAMQEAGRCLRDGGRIINISSGVTIGGGAGASVYAGSKGAVEQFTLAASREFGARGITVNTVSPGMTETDLLRAVVPAEARAERAQSAPLGRLGTPEDIADIVVFVAGAGGRWLTGQNLRATGGAS